MAIDVTCVCGKVSSARVEDVGKRARCRACGGLVTIVVDPPPKPPVQANPARAVASVLGFACLILAASVYERHSAAVDAGRERDEAISREAKLKDEVAALVRGVRASTASIDASTALLRAREEADAEAAAAEIRRAKQEELDSASQRKAGEAAVAASNLHCPPGLWYVSKACARFRDDDGKYVVLVERSDGRRTARAVSGGLVDPEEFHPEFFEWATLPLDQFLSHAAASLALTGESFRVLNSTEQAPGDYQADVCGVLTGKVYDLRVKKYHPFNLFLLDPAHPLPGRPAAPRGTPP